MSLWSATGTIDCGDTPVVSLKRFVPITLRTSSIQSCSSSSLWGRSIGSMRTAAMIRVLRPCAIQQLWEVVFTRQFRLWPMRYVTIDVGHELWLTRLNSIVILWTAPMAHWPLSAMSVFRTPGGGVMLKQSGKSGV